MLSQTTRVFLSSLKARAATWMLRGDELVVHQHQRLGRDRGDTPPSHGTRRQWVIERQKQQRDKVTPHSR